MKRLGILVLAVVACVCGSAAAQVFIDGRLVMADASYPVLSPTTEQCNNAHEQNLLILLEISKAHEACLNQNPSDGGSSGTQIFFGQRVGSCSKAKCQEFHGAREVMQASIRDGYRGCTDRVAASDGSISYDVRSAFKSIASGPLTAVRLQARSAISRFISDVFPPAASVTKPALNTTAAARRIWVRSSALLAACQANQQAAAAVRECDDELRNAFRDLGRATQSREPGIALIQNALLEELLAYEALMMPLLEQIDRDMRSVR